VFSGGDRKARFYCILRYCWKNLRDRSVLQNTWNSGLEHGLPGKSSRLSQRLARKYSLVFAFLFVYKEIGLIGFALFQLLLVNKSEDH